METCGGEEVAELCLGRPALPISGDATAGRDFVEAPKTVSERRNLWGMSAGKTRT